MINLTNQQDSLIQELIKKVATLEGTEVSDLPDVAETNINDDEDEKNEDNESRDMEEVEWMLKQEGHPVAMEGRSVSVYPVSVEMTEENFN